MIAVCPKCDVKLLLLHFQGLEVDFCERCRGIWLDDGELEALLDPHWNKAGNPLLEALRQSGAGAAGPKHLCPRCDRRLHEITLRRDGPTALTLDRCPRGHGIWFDADELQQLLEAFPAASGAGHVIECLNDLFGKPKRGGTTR